MQVMTVDFDLGERVFKWIGSMQRIGLSSVRLTVRRIAATSPRQREWLSWLALHEHSRYAGGMTSPARPYAEQVAVNLLNRYGLAVIWQLHLSATRAYGEGNKMGARSIIDIADAAEKELQRRRAADLKVNPK